MNFHHPDGTCVDVLVPRRALLIMTGESRFLWSHGITPRKSDVTVETNCQNQRRLTQIKRDTRTSFTFRALRHEPCQCSEYFGTYCVSQYIQNSHPMLADVRPVLMTMVHSCGRALVHSCGRAVVWGETRGRGVRGSWRGGAVGGGPVGGGGGGDLHSPIGLHGFGQNEPFYNFVLKIPEGAPAPPPPLDKMNHFTTLSLKLAGGPFLW